MEVYSFWKQAGRFPTINLGWIWVLKLHPTVSTCSVCFRHTDLLAISWACHAQFHHRTSAHAVLSAAPFMGPPHSNSPTFNQAAPQITSSHTGYPSNIISIFKVTAPFPLSSSHAYYSVFFFSTYWYLKLCFALSVICLLSEFLNKT